MGKTVYTFVLGLLFALPAFASTTYEFEGGTVTVDSIGVAGSTVTMTVEADSGYVLYSITITDSSGSEIGLVDNGDGSYYFVMPDREITINVIFKPIYTITVSGTTDTTGVVEVDSSGSSSSSTSPIVLSPAKLGASVIRSSGSALRISTNTAQTVRVYGVNGRLVKAVSVPAGETFVGGLKSGFYMVKLSDGTKASVGIK